jgi:hypothetical protein
VCIQRVRLADGQPVAIEDAVFSGSLTALLDGDLADGSLHEAVTVLGRNLTSGAAKLTTRQATRDDATLLEVPVGSLELKNSLSRSPNSASSSQQLTARYAPQNTTANRVQVASSASIQWQWR